MLSAGEFENLVGRLGGRRVLVVGDIILDEYVWGDVRRISPEAPVPIVLKRRLTYRSGGAANVAANLAALDGVPLLAGVVGVDGMAMTLEDVLRSIGVSDVSGLVRDPMRPTTVKSRIMGHSQQMLRIDSESTEAISSAIATALVAWCETHVAGADACLLSDYAKGVLTEEVCQSVIRLAIQHRVPVVVDPKGRHFGKYRGATVITPNEHEVQVAAASEDIETPLDEMVGDLRRQVGDAELLVTRGAEGMSLYLASGAPIQFPAAARRVYDVTGAGDTVAATVALGLAAGADLPTAAQLATTAAGIVVGKVGTATASRTELLQSNRLALMGDELAGG